MPVLWHWNYLQVFTIRGASRQRNVLIACLQRTWKRLCLTVHREREHRRITLKDCRCAVTCRTETDELICTMVWRRLYLQIEQ